MTSTKSEENNSIEELYVKIVIAQCMYKYAKSQNAIGGILREVYKSVPKNKTAWHNKRSRCACGMLRQQWLHKFEWN